MTQGVIYTSFYPAHFNSLFPLSKMKRGHKLSFFSLSAPQTAHVVFMILMSANDNRKSEHKVNKHGAPPVTTENRVNTQVTNYSQGTGNFLP